MAGLFALQPRTFGRFLAAEGAAFQKLVDEVRFEIARDLLANSEMALGQVAAVLNFSQPSAFTRAFHRWSGQSQLGCGRRRAAELQDRVRL
jgi:AraC-like DNA-binding protein